MCHLCGVHCNSSRWKFFKWLWHGSLAFQLTYFVFRHLSWLRIPTSFMTPLNKISCKACTHVLIILATVGRLVLNLSVKSMSLQLSRNFNYVINNWSSTLKLTTVLSPKNCTGPISPRGSPKCEKYLQKIVYTAASWHKIHF